MADDDLPTMPFLEGRKMLEDLGVTVPEAMPAISAPDPDLDPEHRIASVAAGDSDMEEAFLKAARAVLGAWDRGTFLPRLIRARGDREPRPCEWCRVSEACHGPRRPGAPTAPSSPSSPAGQCPPL